MCNGSIRFRKDTFYNSSLVEEQPFRGGYVSERYGFGSKQSWKDEAETVKRCRMGVPSTKCKDGARLSTSHGRSTKKDTEQKLQVFSDGRDFKKENIQMQLAEMEVQRKEVVRQNSRNNMQFNSTEEAKRPLLYSSTQQLEEIRFDGLDVSKDVT